MCSIPAHPAGKLFQNVFREDATAPDLHSLLHQLNKDVFACLADRRQVLQVDDEFAAVQIRVGHFVRDLQLVGPRADKLALKHQPALISRFDSRDFQHASSLHRKERKAHANLGEAVTH